VQPSSVDVRVDRKFRVFHNARYPYIDVRKPMDDLTELIEVDGDEPFVLHPGEFVLGQTLEAITLPDDIVARLEGKSSLGRLGPPDPLHRRLRRPVVGRQPHARAVERREPADHYLPRHADRQISFMRMDGPVEQPYGGDEVGSKYQGRRSRRPRVSTATSSIGALGAVSRPTRYHSGSSRRVEHAKHRTARDRRHPRHRADRVRAEAPARARPVDGKGIREFKSSLSSDKDDDDEVREIERASRRDRGAGEEAPVVEGEVVHDRRT
jgi:dCTP deaminase